MVMVNLQVEDDNNHESVLGNKTSVDEIFPASNKEDLKLEMIRLYRGMFENNNTSSSVVIPMASVSKNSVEMELMIRNVYRETICPMICADINQMHQNFLIMIRDRFGLDLSTGMTWNLCNMESTSGSQSLQLKFLNGISTPISTGKIIQGNEQQPFLVALVDEISGQIVTTGSEAAMEVEIVVLEGGSNDDEADNWTPDEFNDKIVSEWNGKKVLKGNRFVKLNEGTVYVGNISFTHNSKWKGKRMFRMGARSVAARFSTCVKDAKTESFHVSDKRSDFYSKHEIPSLSDRLYRLEMFSRHAGYFKRLTKAGIKTVMDLLTLHAINPQKLKKIFDVPPIQYETIMNHAKVCKDDKGIYLYHYPRDRQTSNGVVFNISGQLVGIVAESNFVSCDNLTDNKRADAQKLILSSSEHWKEVVSFNDQDSLRIHLQSRPTLNPPAHNHLNVAIPHRICPHNHTFPASQSQSLKRPASEHETSNSPKQPRYEHPKLNPSMPNVGMDTSMRHEANNLESEPEEFDISMYLNYLQDGWKTVKIVCCAVGWISMISKLRKMKTTFCDDNTVIVIATSIEHAETCD